MSPVTVTTWTCARCGTVEQVDGMGQPPNWCRVSFATPPQSAEARAVGDLCNPCGGYLVTFVNGGDVAAEEQRAADLRALVAEIEEAEA